MQVSLYIAGTLNTQVPQPARRNGVIRQPLESQVDIVEWRQEQDDQYRRIRIERCDALPEVWQGFEAKEFAASELNTRTVEVIQRALRTRDAEIDEEAQSKAQELSGNRQEGQLRAASDSHGGDGEYISDTHIFFVALGTFQVPLTG